MAKYARVEYLKDIKTGDVDSLGNVIQLDQDLKKGDVELVTAYAYKLMKHLFPNSISGVELEEKELGAFLNTLFQKLKSEINKLPSTYSDSHLYLDYIIEEFCDRTTLELRYTNSNVDNLASKIYMLQEKLRNDKVLFNKDDSVKSHK